MIYPKILYISGTFLISLYHAQKSRFVIKHFAGPVSYCCGLRSFVSAIKLTARDWQEAKGSIKLNGHGQIHDKIETCRQPTHFEHISVAFDCDLTVTIATALAEAAKPDSQKSSLDFPTL